MPSLSAYHPTWLSLNLKGGISSQPPLLTLDGVYLLSAARCRCTASALHHRFPPLRRAGSGQTGDGTNECRHSRNQRTEMDWNG